MERKSQVNFRQEAGTVPYQVVEAGQQEVQIVFKKTPIMIQVEERFAQEGETIADLLKRLYAFEGKSFADIGLMFGLHGNTINTWVRKLLPEIAIRHRSSQDKGETQKKLWQNPQHRAKRVASLRLAWQDPEKRRRQLLAHQSMQARSNNSKARKEYFRQHPESLNEFRRKGIEGIKKAKRERIIAAFGDNPKETMRQMVIVEGLTIFEISRRLGKTTGTISRWLKECGVKPKPTRIDVDYETLVARREMIKEAIEKGYFKHLTKAQQQTLRALYLGRSRFPTQSSLAEKFHCTRANISLREINGLKRLQIKREAYLSSKPEPKKN